MGRYVYDANLVTQTIEELNAALTSIDSVTSEIQAGISTITSARGAEHIDVSYSQLSELQVVAEEVINEDIRTIQAKATMIEEYEQAPWYKKLFASAGLTLTKFAEGVATTFEDLGDGVVSIAGFVGGIFNSEFQESCAEYVKEEHVGEWFAEKYEGDGALGWMNKYSWYSHTSTAANIFKGIGCAAPYVALSMTGVGLVTETVAAGVSGIGQGTETGLQQGKTYNQAFASGLWQGTKNAALVYGMGKLSQGIQANTARAVSSSADDIAKLTSGNADDVASAAKEIFGTTDDLVATVDDAGNYIIKNSKTMEIVGDVTLDGSNTIVRSFGNATDAAKATGVFAKSGDGVVYNALKNTDDLLGTSLDDLAKTATGGNAFTKAGELGNTKAGQILNASDDVLGKAGNVVAKSPLGKATGWVTDKVVNGKVVQAVVNNGAVQKVAGAVTNTIAKHPKATFAVAAGVFTADQIGQTADGTEYMLEQAQLTAPTVITPPPTTPITTPTTPIETTTVVTTTTTTPTETTPSGGGGGGGGYTPTVTTPTVTTPTITTPIITTPTETTPTETTPPAPVITTPQPSYPTVTTPSGGGGYSGEGYIGEDPEIGETDDLEGELSGSLSEIIGGNDYTKIPTSSAPITTTTTTGQKKSVIPVIAGLSAAAVAGIGTKAYLDKKENEDSEEEFDAEEWSEEDSINVDYNEAMEEENDYLSPSDEYAYQEGEEAPVESYEAVNSSELASMQ